MTGDRPDARELIAAVAQWLTEELAPALEPGPRFQAIVAAQGLAITARELDLRPEHAAADAAAFETLLPGVSAGDPRHLRMALSRAIALGHYDDDLARVSTVLREHVRRKLAIARPGYDLEQVGRGHGEP